MVSYEEDVRKLQDFLKKRGVNLPEAEIEKRAKALYELGLFVVRRKVKTHSKPATPQNAEGFEQITREPP